MTTNPVQYLVNILNIVGYGGNKKEYADKFYSICQDKALLLTVKNLSSLAKKDFNDSLSKKKSLEDILKVMDKFLSRDIYLQNLDLVTLEAFDEYFKKVIPTLNSDERAKLGAYLSKVKVTV